MGQNLLVRQPAVRKKLGIPKYKRHEQTATAKKGFVQAVKEGKAYLFD